MGHWHTPVCRLAASLRGSCRHDAAHDMYRLGGLEGLQADMARWVQDREAARQDTALGCVSDNSPKH